MAHGFAVVDDKEIRARFAGEATLTREDHIWSTTFADPTEAILREIKKGRVRPGHQSI